MGTVACTRMMQGLVAPAARRGIRLRLLDEAPGAPVRLLQWPAAAGCPAAAIAGWRATAWTGRTLLLVDGSGDAIAAGLDAGADDATSTNADPAEIVARLASLLRESAAPTLRIGPLTIDRVRRTVTRNGRSIALLPREYTVLLYLAERAGVPVSRSELLTAVWGLRHDPGTNVVAVQVCRLRAKLDRGPGPVILHTDPGQGYRLGTAGDCGVGAGSLA